MKLLFQAAALPVILLLCIGCTSGPTIVPVKGIATRNGQPLKYLSLTFYPADDGRPSTSRTDEEGRFELSYDKDTKGAAVGMHKVAAVFRPRGSKEEFDLAAGKITLHPDQDLINEKYGTREATPLTIEVTAAGQPIELKFD